MTGPDPVLGPPVPALVAARAYLRAELDARSNPLTVDVQPPAGEPAGYGLLSLLPSHQRSRFTVDYAIRVRVFDPDAVRCHRNTDLVWALMTSATHRKVQTPLGAVWISAACPGEPGPSDLDDEDVPELFGLQFSVFWTIALKPL